ncbi:hypothetical protein JW835_16690 [bacterium]|nr:hypothetical protein [bacterium]
MTVKHCWIFAFLFYSISLIAQSPFQAGVHFSLGIPQKEFADNLDAVGFGGGGQFFYRLPQTGVSFGLGLDFYVYGSETRKESLKPFAPEIDVDITRTNGIFQGFLMMRLQPRSMRITPYADGIFGFNYLVTSTSVKNESSNEEIASSTNYDDAAMCYGGGAGLLIRVYKNEITDPEESEFSVSIDLGFRVLNGGEADYLKKGDIEITEEYDVIYHVNHSRTDLITINLGVSFSF